MPFKSISADFFDLAGVHYLVTVARLSGWINITRAAAGTSGAGAKGLIACLRSLFADKGVPETLWSDGGNRFTLSQAGWLGTSREEDTAAPAKIPAL